MTLITTSLPKLCGIASIWKARVDLHWRIRFFPFLWDTFHYTFCKTYLLLATIATILVDIGCFFYFLDPPTIKTVTVSSDKSWIGQKVTLTCKSDGFPLPTLTWYKPDGSQLNSNTVEESTVDVKMSFDQDFGIYNCVAGNGLAPADHKTVEIKQISTSFWL